VIKISLPVIVGPPGTKGQHSMKVHRRAGKVIAWHMKLKTNIRIGISHKEQIHILNRHLMIIGTLFCRQVGFDCHGKRG
jgi:hypothetical protein